MDDSLPQRGLGNGGHKWTLNQADPRFRSESAIAFFSKNATVRSYPAHPSLVKSTTACLFLQFKPKEDLVGTSGLEPPTSRLSGVRSNQLSYKPFLIRQPPAFPCRLQHSIIGRFSLNRRVRDGYGCFPEAHRHRKSFVINFFL